MSINTTRQATHAIIEIAGNCQAKCPFCQRDSMSKRHQGDLMSVEKFEKIIVHLLELGVLSKTGLFSIPLYNWGEPFLNKEINQILAVLKARNIYADISSNFMLKPKVEISLLPVISNITLSISGFSEESYKRIFGGSLKKVLANFDFFYKIVREYSPNTRFTISWHRYKFNEHEFWDAFRYFNRPGITFMPIVAYINNGIEFLSFIEGTLSDDRLQKAKEELFLDHICSGLNYHQKYSQEFYCPAWDFLTIDEKGELLLCCAISNYEVEHCFGNILNMSSTDIWDKKISDPYCKECIDLGIAGYAYSQGINNPVDKPWPSGGGFDYIRLWSKHNLTVSKAKRFISRIPYAKRLYQLYKKTSC